MAGMTAQELLALAAEAVYAALQQRGVRLDSRVLTETDAEIRFYWENWWPATLRLTVTPELEPEE